MKMHQSKDKPAGCCGELCLPSRLPSRRNKRLPRAVRPRPSPFRRNETYTLPNGLKVTLVPYGIIPKAALSLAVDAGEMNEGSARVGVAGSPRT